MKPDCSLKNVPACSLRRMLSSMVCAAFVCLSFLLKTPAAMAANTVVSLSFDDGSADQPLAAQLLNQRGIKATFYINSAMLGSSGWYMALSDVQALAAAGHEIGGHTLHHLDLPTITSTSAYSEVCDDRTNIIKLGLNPNPVSFAYPYGDYNPTVEAIPKSCGYLSGRGVGELDCPGCPITETIPPANAFVVRTPQDIQVNTTLANMQSYVTKVEQSGGGWVNIIMHHLCDGCDTYSTTTTTLAGFLDWLQPRAGQGTVIQTVGQVIAGATPGNPQPILTAISPNNAAPGAAASTLTATGFNFINGSIVRWNGSNRTTTFLNSTTLTAAILATDLATVGTASVTVFNPAPGGGTSTAVGFTIAQPNPAPALATIVPSSGVAGNPGFSLTVNGSGFINGSAVLWNGSSRVTTFVSSTTLRAAVLSSDLSSSGQAGVTVFNPAPGGGTSASAAFTIVPPNPAPVLTAVAQSSAAAGDPGFTLTVNGSGFISSSAVLWNGSSRATTFVNSTTLRAAILSGDLVSSGTVNVTVFNPAPGGGTSTAVAFTIVHLNPAPVLAAVVPDAVVVGTPGTTLTIMGNDFISSSTVLWNGQSQPTTFISSRTLIVAIGFSELMSTGTVAVTVYTPPPGGGAPVPVAIKILSPSISASVAQVKVSPNPWRAGDRNITIGPLPPNSTVKVFTMSARLVKTLDASGVWDLTNNTGESVASGFYIYLVTDGNDQKRGLIGVIR
jgi:peptidoglycan/xylan/chitin deacetylase (PgdA/CDA1 family)